ncbi:unnamed protein product [Hyaloperonospora brassicae]|uniref:RxLR effector candidate protein n=1 Tax=Hyaloperonospora brassicae TaxID=162125 RepID=A0AAV0TMX3_HYABA|nr:unnamed protein product [Hyaloperonospora brassicae]
MAKTRLGLSTRLVLLVAIVCACSVGSAVADAALRLLRTTEQDDNYTFSDKTTLDAPAVRTPRTAATEAATVLSAETPQPAVDPPHTPSSHTTTETESKGSTPAPHSTTETGSKASTPASHSTSSETKPAEAHAPAHEGPTMMMLVGPAVAGVLAILLIGAVIVFKNRMNKQ